MLMDSYAFDSSYSYGPLVEMIKVILAAKILAYRHVKHEHHITINLDVNIENG
jgi:hypothetical protein